jgi:hypothetical protein
VIQGALVIALAVIAWQLHRTRPHPRTALRGLSGPAVTLLACALGGLMSGGAAQRVADWLDGTGSFLAGPPVPLTWQSSVVPALLLVLPALGAGLGRRTWLLRRTEQGEVPLDHPGEPQDPSRTRAIATTRAMATLTDRTPLVVAVTSATTLLLGAGAVVGGCPQNRRPARPPGTPTPSCTAPRRPRRPWAPG